MALPAEPAAPTPGAADPCRQGSPARPAPPIGPSGSWSPARRRWMGGLLSGVWLVFLVNPFLEGWRRRETGAGWVGVLATVAFGTAYVVAFNDVRDRRTYQLTIRAPLRRAAFWVVLHLALAVVICLAVGDSGMACAVYLAVLCVMFLPGRAALVTTLVIAGLAWVVPVLVPGWTGDDGSLSVSVLISAFAMWGVKALMRRNVDLVLAEQENARLAVEQERGRLARDLHDILGHSLTVITVKAELAQRLLDVDPERARSELADLERLSRDALVDVRRAVEGYRELTLPGEIARARAALEAAQIRAELPGSADMVPGDLREVFAWAVREGVTNVLRHSGATSCRISLGPDRVEVVDDGVGSPGSASSTGSPGSAGSGSGNGLRGLRERGTAAGTVLITGPVQPRGFRLALLTREAFAPAPGSEPERVMTPRSDPVPTR